MLHRIGENSFFCSPRQTVCSWLIQFFIQWFNIENLLHVMQIALSRRSFLFTFAKRYRLKKAPIIWIEQSGTYRWTEGERGREKKMPRNFSLILISKNDCWIVKQAMLWLPLNAFHMIFSLKNVHWQTTCLHYRVIDLEYRNESHFHAYIGLMK